MKVIRCAILWGGFVLLFVQVSTAFGNPDTYEADDGKQEAKLIVINADLAQTHSFHDAGDEDWVFFFAIPGEKYDFSVRNVGAFCDPVVTLFDTDGETVLSGPTSLGFEGEDEFLSYNFSAEGFYSLRITEVNGGFGDGFVYDLRADILVGSNAGKIKGFVRDSSGIPIPSGNPIPKVRIKTSGNIPATVDENGAYELDHSPGDLTVWVEADGYQTVQRELYMPEAKILFQDFELSKLPAGPGDVNGDGEIDLADVVLSLQIVAGIGIDAESVDLSGDLDGKEGIGLAEAVFGLQTISRNR